MLDTTELTDAVERFSDRLRAAPQSRLQRGAAAEGLALARELSVRAQRLEAPGERPRIMPDAGVFAVADQLLVAGRDLAEVLRTAPQEAADTPAAADGEESVDRSAAADAVGAVDRSTMDAAVALVRAAAARAEL
ncbi:hypothetical protein JE024_20985 [Streptomyces zhihengii]|uniref:Uncharacterized protein n=1 Tax=Streptomyces zhihengii TaxID=1818004 RepID=A0ABS2UUG5_9ACTN|nr:hypothetical protein [Streptomyces zhihengii]MBM9621170.1 hypothetical protein [Streptomyces zhihengii]